MAYFTKHWPAELLSDVEQCVDDVVRTQSVQGTVAILISAQFKERYEVLRGQTQSKSSVLAAKPRINKLLQELSDDEDCDHPDKGPKVSEVSEDPSRPWLPEFQAYLDTTEHVPDDWTTIQWW